MNAQPMRCTLTAWKVSEFSGQGHPLDIAGADNLTAAITSAAMQCAHKDTFMVLQRDPVSGAGTLHLYRVKQSAKPQRVPHSDGTWRMVKPLEPQFLTRIEVRAFDVVEPWRWSPGADVVGRSDVLEGTAA